jgi:hypothetical protein
LKANESNSLHSIKNTEGIAGCSELEAHHLVRVRVNTPIAESPSERHQKGDPVVLIAVNLEVRNDTGYNDGCYVHHTAASRAQSVDNLTLDYSAKHISDSEH